MALDGALRLDVAGESQRRELTLDDFRTGEIILHIPEPDENIEITATFESNSGKTWTRHATVEPARLRSWRYYVQRCVDTLLEYGTDRYGARGSPLFMAVLDVQTLVSPERPELLDALVRLEEDRLHRRAERGANPWYDQALLRSMVRLTKVTGEKKYAEAVDACLEYFLEHCRKPDGGPGYRNGMPVWGTHIFWDCYRDRPGGDGQGVGPHEILVYLPEWERMYAVHPEGVKRMVEGIWRWHIVDKKTGMHNRHDDGRRGCDFAFSGGSFVLAFAFMYRATSEDHWLEKAKLVADWHWKNRNAETGLVPDAPSLGSRYDATHAMTCVTGPHVTQLLRASEVSGDPHFRARAFSYLKAYDRYGWDEKTGSYFGMLTLDGTPVPGGVELDREGNPIPEQKRKDPSNYGAWAPAGHVDIWRTAIYSYEFPLVAAQASVYAYEQSAADGSSGDPDLLRIAERWARAIERELPPRTGRRWKIHLEEAMPAAVSSGGTYAENYGRVISFFVHLARATGETRYLAQAEKLAREAVEKLFHNGLFRGHPAKPYYETTNGVGFLLFALLELDSPSENLGGAL